MQYRIVKHGMVLHPCVVGDGPSAGVPPKKGEGERRAAARRSVWGHMGRKRFTPLVRAAKQCGEAVRSTRQCRRGHCTQCDRTVLARHLFLGPVPSSPTSFKFPSCKI